MLVGIEEIDPAPTEMMVDLSRYRPCRVGPESQALALDSLEPAVEFLVADQESIMLLRDRPLLLIKVE